MDLLKSWQEAALQTEGYTATRIYPAIVSIIVNSEKQVDACRMHAYHVQCCRFILLRYHVA